MTLDQQLNALVQAVLLVICDGSKWRPLKMLCLVMKPLLNAVNPEMDHSACDLPIPRQVNLDTWHQTRRDLRVRSLQNDSRRFRFRDKCWLCPLYSYSWLSRVTKAKEGGFVLLSVIWTLASLRSSSSNSIDATWFAKRCYRGWRKYSLLSWKFSCHLDWWRSGLTTILIFYSQIA